MNLPLCPIFTAGEVAVELEDTAATVVDEELEDVAVAVVEEELEDEAVVVTAAVLEDEAVGTGAVPTLSVEDVVTVLPAEETAVTEDVAVAVVEEELEDEAVVVADAVREDEAVGTGAGPTLSVEDVVTVLPAEETAVTVVLIVADVFDKTAIAVETALDDVERSYIGLMSPPTNVLVLRLLLATC